MYKCICIYIYININSILKKKNSTRNTYITSCIHWSIELTRYFLSNKICAHNEIYTVSGPTIITM